MKKNLSLLSKLLARVLGTGIACLAFTSTATAQINVPITNAGFENPLLADGAETGGAPGWTTVSGAIFGIYNPTTAAYTAEAPEGSNVAYVADAAAGGGLAQVLSGASSAFQADADYTLAVKVGNPLNFAFDGYIVQLLAGSTVIAEDDNSQSVLVDSFVPITVNYTYDAGLHAALVGQQLAIRLLRPRSFR